MLKVDGRSTHGWHEIGPRCSLGMCLGGVMCVSGFPRSPRIQDSSNVLRMQAGRVLVRQKIGCSVWRDWVLQADGLVGLKAETRSESLIPTRRGGVRAGSPLLHVISF